MKPLRLTILIALIGVVELAHGRDPQLSAGPQWFAGGAGGTAPSPPVGQAPYDPSLTVSQAAGPFILNVVGPHRRLVVLRDRRGVLLSVRVTDDEGRLILPVPTGGALLDVLGTDALGLPVQPWQRMTVVAE